MKRAADHQLTKEGGEDTDDEVEEVPKSGFQIADESVLATRPIRGLPKRSAAAANASSAPTLSAITTEPAANSKFSGFQAFGTSTTASTSFFPSSAPPAAPKLAPSSQPSSLFGGPSVSSSASSATKAFASIVGSSSSSEPPASATIVEDDQSEIDYYKALRGLNVSFLAAVSKAIESDPFADVAELLERYKALRITVKSDFEAKSKTTPKAPSATSFTESKPAETPKPAPSFSMPAPPSSFAGFKPPAPSSTATTSPLPSSGFVPKIDTGSSGSLGSPFSFASSKPRAESSATTEAPKSTFSFGLPSNAGPTTSTPANAFTFGAAASSSSTSIFGGKPPASTSSTSLFPPSSSSSTSLFGPSASSSSIFGSGSPFGAKADSSNDADSETEPEKEKGKDARPPISFFAPSSGASTPFGGASSSGGTGGATTPEKDKEKSASATSFSFGSASPAKPSPFLFGAAATKAGGSIGNPVGWGFGSPPKTDVDASTGPVKSLPFAFTPLKPITTTFGSGLGFVSAAAAAEEDKAEGSSGDGTPALPSSDDAQPPPLLASASVHDVEGEGEEDEETTHELRSKVFKMTKDKDGQAKWGDLGVGVLRLKRHKETDARRMLLRNSATGKITINFLIHGGMNPTASDKIVSFMGHSEGASTPYRIRCKTADQAKELRAALDREIEFVKSKGSHA